MHKIIDSINITEFKGLKAGKLLDVNAKEILTISLEKAALFPKHSSPRDASLILLEGNIVFHINNQEFELKKHQVFCFPKEEEHWVKAVENSKFLIIR